MIKIVGNDAISEERNQILTVPFQLLTRASDANRHIDARDPQLIRVNVSWALPND